ncbi:MAG: aldo/keto reductase [Gammaproteobacteria bacterium]|nr:aldo/keto reductase [Gammaproteobacteria bacterium]
MKNIGNITLAAWVVTFLLGYFGLGAWLYEVMEGMDRSMVPLARSIAFAIGVVTSIVLTVMWARNLGSDAPVEDKPSGRRKFLLGGAAVTGGVLGGTAAVVAKLSPWLQSTVPMMNEVGQQVLTAETAHESWKGSRIVSKRPLGSTGFMVSDISLGSGRIMRHTHPEDLFREALDRGINYIDTSPDYAGAMSETTIGNVLKDRKRAELFVVTKWCTSEGHVRQGSTPEDYIAALDDSLSRLQTDYVDLVHVHACDTVERLLDPNMLEAFEIAKEQGKVRFLGVSTHTPNLEEVANAAIDSGKIDVMMLAYHHGAWPKQQEIIKRAAEKGIGIVAMKTLKGAKHRGMVEFRDDATSYTQAAFKWVNSDPNVSCLVVSFFENEHLDEYLHASGQSLTEADVAVLDKYDDLIAGTHCFSSCGDCLNSCPESLPINDVLRHRMYFEDYGDEKEAMLLYAALDKQADKCVTCSAPCTGACPEDIDIKFRMVGAHERLTMIA